MSGPNYLRGLLGSDEPEKEKNFLASLLGALQDPQFYRDMGENTRQVSGGLLTGTLGAPVDIATMMMRPGGYNVPDKDVVGSSNHLAGLLGLDAESTPYKVGNLLPNDPGDALRYGGLMGAGMVRKMQPEKWAVADELGARAGKAVSGGQYDDAAAMYDEAAKHYREIGTSTAMKHAKANESMAKRMRGPDRAEWGPPPK